jgi:hypothetical protein
MIAYVFWKSSLSVNCKINNVTSISDGQIIGDTTINFGTGSDYIILENSIDKNIGDTMDLTNLVDQREYFTMGKEYWLMKQIKQVNDINTTLNDRLKTLETDPPLVHQVTNANALIDDLSQMMVEISTMSLV